MMMKKDRIVRRTIILMLLIPVYIMLTGASTIKPCRGIFNEQTDIFLGLPGIIDVRALLLKSLTQNSGEIIINGTIIEREEKWDRRPNELMGRPDILKEIILSVNVDSVVQGHIPPGIVLVSIKGRELIIEYKAVPRGARGVFRLKGEKPPYTLTAFEKKGTDVKIKEKPGSKPKDGNKPKPSPEPYLNPKGELTEAQMDEMLKTPERILGKFIKGSKSFQIKAVKTIAREYGMIEASIKIMITNTGPRPPEGGYVLWGVKGKIKGKWHIWQGGKIKKGEELDDPHRYDK